jgi:hypothetical protein
LELVKVIGDVKVAALACHTIADQSREFGGLLNFIADSLDGTHAKLTAKWEALFAAIQEEDRIQHS